MIVSVTLGFTVNEFLQPNLIIRTVWIITSAHFRKMNPINIKTQNLGELLQDNKAYLSQGNSFANGKFSKIMTM